MRQKFLHFNDFDSLNSMLSYGKLFEQIHGDNSSVERALWPVFDGYVVVRLFSKLFRSHTFLC